MCTRNSALIVATLFGACSGLKLSQPLASDASEWRMFARYETRVNATGETVNPPLTLEWQYDVTGGIGNGSPLIVDSVLIVGNLRGELYAINTNNGKRLGWIDLGDAIQNSPVIDGNVAIVSLSNTEFSLVGFDLYDGKPQWRKDYGDIETSPLLYHQKIYVGNVGGVFYCVDRETGERVWKYELPENTRNKGIRSSAAAGSNIVAFGAEDGFLYGLNAERGNQEWSYNTGASVVGSPSIANGNAYIGNLSGTICAIDLHSGKPQWKFEAGSGVYASPSFAENRIFVGTTGGMMYALDASTGSMVWEKNLGSVINSSATIAGDMLYVGTLKKTLFGLKTSDGTIVLKQEVPGRIKTSPAVAHGRLFVATDEKLILAFRSSSP